LRRARARRHRHAGIAVHGSPASAQLELGLPQRPPFKRDLEARVAREIRMSNDANCFAVSEAQDGAAAARTSCSA
jgi:predicted NBD/HSP70 family sugar kinase